MEKIILIPENFCKSRGKSSAYDYMSFFNKLHEDLNFDIQWTNKINITNNTKVIISFAIPHFSQPDFYVNELVNLNSNIKLVSWTADLHCWSRTPKLVKKCKDNTLKIFDRSDLILTAFDNRMKKLYKKYLHKYVYIPWCFTPHEKYVKFKFNKNPKIQCLMVGATSCFVYSLRRKIKKYSKINNQIKCAAHIPRDTYPNLLHEYLCGIVDVGHNEALQPKHFEIPAVGSLLLAHRTNLVDDLGFVPYKHYVPFSGKDVFGKVNKIISNPDKYKDIRLEGMKFVRQYHSINNRLEQIYNILKKYI